MPHIYGRWAVSYGRGRLLSVWLRQEYLAGTERCCSGSYVPTQSKAEGRNSSGDRRKYSLASCKTATISRVSMKHANFIVNTGNASAADVLRLIKHVQEEVKRKLGYTLETEIAVIGER